MPVTLSDQLSVAQRVLSECIEAQDDARDAYTLWQKGCIRLLPNGQTIPVGPFPSELAKLQQEADRAAFEAGREVSRLQSLLGLGKGVR